MKVMTGWSFLDRMIVRLGRKLSDHVVLILDMYREDNEAQLLERLMDQQEIINQQRSERW
jgi:hypothetical protein